MKKQKLLSYWLRFKEFEKMSFVPSTFCKFYAGRDSYSIRFVIFRKMTFVLSTICIFRKLDIRTQHDSRKWEKRISYWIRFGKRHDLKMDCFVASLLAMTCVFIRRFWNEFRMTYNFIWKYAYAVTLNLFQGLHFYRFWIKANTTTKVLEFRMTGSANPACAACLR